MDDIKTVEYALKLFNQQHQCSFELGEQLGSGRSAKVYALTEPRIHGSLFPWSRQHKTKALFDAYRDCGYVMKVMRTDVYYPSSGTATASGVAQEDNKRWYEREIRLMTKLNDSGYTVPLLASTVVTLAEADMYLLCMPRFTPLCDYFTGPLDESQLLKLGIDIAHAIKCCYDLQIEQRDIKRGNVYARKLPDGSVRFILGDFGFSRSYEEDPIARATSRHTQIGNENAPVELWKENCRYREFAADVAELGHMLRLEAQTAGYLEKDGIEVTDLHKLYDLSPEFLQVITKAIHPDPWQRYANGAELLAALESLPKPAAGRSTNLIRSRNYSMAAAAIASGNYGHAMVYARAGAERGETGCRFLEQYCVVRELIARNSADLRDQIDDLLFDSPFENSMTLATHPTEQAAFKCLLALLYRLLGDREREWAHMQHAAEDGFIPARYYFGRMLLESPDADDADRDLANQYLMDAMELGFCDAIRYSSQGNCQDFLSLKTLLRIDEMREMKRLGREALWEHRHGITAFVRHPEI